MSRVRVSLIKDGEVMTGFDVPCPPLQDNRLSEAEEEDFWETLDHTFADSERTKKWQGTMSNLLDIPGVHDAIVEYARTARDLGHNRGYGLGWNDAAMDISSRMLDEDEDAGMHVGRDGEMHPSEAAEAERQRRVATSRSETRYQRLWNEVRGALERGNIVQARIWAGLPPREG